MAGEYATSLRKTPVVATPPKAVAPKVVPKQAAPVVEKPRAASPAPVSTPVVPHQAAPVVEAPRAAPAPMTDANSANARENRTQNFISGGTGKKGVDLTAIGGPNAEGKYVDTSYEANAARMAPILDFTGVTGVGRVASTIASIPFDMAANKVGTTHYVGKLPIHNYYDVPNADGTVSHNYKQAALESLPIYGGTVLRGVGKGIGAAYRAAGKGINKFVGDVPDPIAKFQTPGNGKGLAEDELFGNAEVKIYEGPSRNPGPNLDLTKSTGTKIKAGVAAAGAATNPLGAGASAVAQDISIVPRSVVSRMTRELGAGAKTNFKTTVNGRQFKVDMPEVAPVSGRAILTQTGPRSFTAEQLAAKAARAEAKDAARSAALTGTGTLAGATVAGRYAGVPDSAAQAVVGNRAITDAGAHTVANHGTKAPVNQSNIDLTQTRAEDTFTNMHNVSNPYVNSATSTVPGETSTPTTTETTEPTKTYAPIAGDFKGGVGQQDVLLKKVF